jgi:hypothetical protein
MVGWWRAARERHAPSVETYGPVAPAAGPSLDVAAPSSPAGSTAREHGRTLAPAFVALSTAIAGLGVQAALHAWLAWRRSPLVQRQRGTLSFISALVGDGVILPVVNAVLAAQLRRWAQPLQLGRLLWALGTGAAFTALAHAAQGSLRLVNWSMPRPFAWNWIGWYHALFMWSQSAYLVYGIQAAVRRWRAGHRDIFGLVGVVSSGIILFAALLAYDYRRSAR